MYFSSPNSVFALDATLPAQSGTVTLPSGQWYWRLQEAPNGSSVLFHHVNRHSDEMRTWVPDRVLTAEAAEAAALEPISRFWLDGWGRRWELSLEPSTTRRSPQSAAREETAWLIFSSGFLAQRVLVPGSTRLGEIPHQNLPKLFAEADAYGGG